MIQPGSVAVARRVAAARLQVAGVASFDYDATQLLAHVLDTSRGLLALAPDLTDDQAVCVESLVRRREQREPLQYILGYAEFYGLDIAVGPGVFIPRPESELLVEYAVDIARAHGGAKLILDLCTGSGALALAVAQQLPASQVIGIEYDEVAAGWARRNAAVTDRRVEIVVGDVLRPTDPTMASHVGSAQIVLCNPPYVPEGSAVDEETRRHDPSAALWSGPEGLDFIAALRAPIARVLVPGGFVVLEHDQTQGVSAPELFRSFRVDGHPVFTEVEDHLDLAGRPRFLTARRVMARSPL